MRRTRLAAFTLLLAVAPLGAEVPVSLSGSLASMVRQNEIATEHDLVFVRTAAELPRLMKAGLLVSLEGNDDYAVAPSVRYPQARPEMRRFIERLAAQYRAATGEKLVVTSLTRPADRQPENAHALSVHPAGVAVDLRVSRRAGSRRWLEKTLLSLEKQGLLDVTRERYPPHYHVALFPAAYLAHLETLDPAPPVKRASAAASAAGGEAASTTPTGSTPGLLAVALVLPFVILVPAWRRRGSRRGSRPEPRVTDTV